MTDTNVDLDRLESLVARFEAAAQTMGVPAELGVEALATLPGHVVSGELIESAWGNLVVDCLTAFAPHNLIRGSSNDGFISIIGEVAVVTTDASGNAVIPFPVAFAAPPQVIPIQGEPGSYGGNTYQIALYDSAVTASQFGIKLIGPTGGGVTNSAVRVNYIAIGRRT